MAIVLRKDNQQRSRTLSKVSRSTWGPALLLTLWSFSSGAQTSTLAPTSPKADVALVTFFSNPISFMAGFPGRKSDGFKGKLFVEHDELADMRPGRFVTVSFVPAAYEFTATTWMAHSPNGGGHLKLDLAAHHHYYIELRDRESAPFTKMFGIKQIACEEAFMNNAKDKPLDPKALTADGKDNVIAETSFPTCPETN